MAASPAFTLFSLNGVDAQKFLQGQVTLNTETLAENQTRYTAICSLKGRIQFGLWLKKISPESFEIVSTEDQATELTNHIKKFAQEARRKLLEQVGAKLNFVLTTDSAELREKTEQLKQFNNQKH